MSKVLDMQISLHDRRLAYLRKVVLRLAVHDQRYNESVQPQDLSKNQDQDHGDEHLALMYVCTHTRVAYNANRIACCEAREAAGESRTQMDETREEGIWLSWVHGS